MTNNNNHVKEYLDYYLGLEQAPGYAVLLRGNWGCGKSWFIKNYMQQNKDHQYLYVSLYGLTSYKEIEDAFFEQIHPFLASKGMKIAGKILKGLIKTTVKIDLDNNKDEVNISSALPEINIPGYLKNIDNRKIIFDDLERCSIPIHNLLGYINQFVEYNELKVVLIANESEIIKIDEKEKNEHNLKSYLTIKEKLIGKSFDINVDFASAMKDFIEEANNLENKKLLENYEFLIHEVFESAGYNNLRHLRQTIFDFERFFSFFPISSHEKDDFLKHVVAVFFAISFELKKGLLKESQISELFDVHLLIQNESVTNSDIQRIQEKYPILKRYNHPINESCWTSFYKYGMVDADELKISIENSIYYKDENTPNWIKLWHCFDLSDEEFILLYDKVFSSFENLEIRDKYVLLQITGMFLSFSSFGLTPCTKDDIIEIAKRNVQNLIKIGNLKVDKDVAFDSYGYYGLGYQSKDTIEFRDFIQYISDHEIITQFDNYPKLAEELLKILNEKTVDNFIEKITISNSGDNLYYEVPILKYIPATEFVETFLKLSNTEKKNFSWQFEKRYRVPSFNSKLKEELDWLKEVYEMMSHEKNRLKGKISYNIIELVLKSLERIINTLGFNS